MHDITQGRNDVIIDDIEIADFLDSNSLGSKELFFELLRYKYNYKVDSEIHIKFPEIKTEGLQKQEILDRYYSRYRLLGREPIANLKVIDGVITLIRLNDKEDTGILEIPAYVERIGRYKNPYEAPIDSQEDLIYPFYECKFNKIVIHNKNKRLTQLRYAFADIASRSLVIELDCPECIVDIQDMFYQSKCEYIDISNITYNSLDSIIGVFQHCTHLIYVNMNTFKNSNIKVVDRLFYRCGMLLNASQLIKKVFSTDIQQASNAFQMCRFKGEFNLGDLNIQSLENQRYMFSSCQFEYGFYAENITFSKLRLAQKMFYNAKHCQDIVFIGCNFPELEEADSMFEQSLIESVQMLNCKFPKLKSFKNAFSNSSMLQSVYFNNSSFDRMNDMRAAFYMCECLEEVGFSGVYLPNLLYMQQTFDGCEELKELDFSTVDLSCLECINFMCNRCTSLKIVNLGNAGRKAGQFWQDEGAFPNSVKVIRNKG